MTYIATHAATIPAKGFSWYLIFLECPFTDEVRREIDLHFTTLGCVVGADALVVRGYDPVKFKLSVFEAPAFTDVDWQRWAMSPALLVTNRAPTDVVGDARELERGKVMIFPLDEIYSRSNSLAGFLTQLVQALHEEDSIAALETLDGTRLQRSWGWLSRYIKMEPGFFGFNVRINDAVRDLLSR
jgi:hypothetical protein